jgi:hypothetical protein
MYELVDKLVANVEIDRATGSEAVTVVSCGLASRETSSTRAIACGAQRGHTGLPFNQIKSVPNAGHEEIDVTGIDAIVVGAAARNNSFH